MKVMGAIGRGFAYVLVTAARVIGGMGNGTAGGTGDVRSVTPETYREMLASRRRDYRP